MTKLNRASEVALERVRLLHDDVINARRALRKQIEDQYAEEMTSLLRKRSRAANEAMELGVPKSRVGRALGTANWATIEEILDLTRDEFHGPGGATAPSERWTVRPGDDGRLGSVIFHRWTTRSGEQSTEPLEVPLRLTPYGYRSERAYVPEVDQAWFVQAITEINAEYNSRGDAA